MCLNVGCIPSKALLHAAKVIDESQAMASHGISFAAPQIDIDQLRSWKEGVVKRLTGGLGGLAKQRKVTVVTGTARFVSPHQIAVEHEGKTTIIGFDNAVIAAGSEPIKMPFIPHDDPRVIDSTGHSNSTGCRSGSWSSAAASSASRWRRSTTRSDPR